MRTVVLGKQTDGTMGLRTATGYNAGTNPPDQTKLTFNADWTLIAPIYQSGSLLSIVQGATRTFTFTSLGYIPLGNFMYKKTGSAYYLSMPVPYKNAAVQLLATVYADYVKVINNTGSTIDVAYLVFGIGTT